MKKFLLRLIVFSIIFISFFFLFYSFIVFEINRNANFRLKKNIHSIILGHSHSACAYNDSIIQNFKNLSQSGESYFFTFYKLQKIVEINPQIKTVYIEFTNNQIDTSMERWTFEKPFLEARLSVYEPFTTFKDKIFLFKKNPWTYFKTLTISTSKMLNRIIYKKYNYNKIIGGFERNTKSYVLAHIKRINDPNFHYNSKLVSCTNIYYLRKIITFLKLKKINFYLIRTPTHKQSIFRKNERSFLWVLNSFLKSGNHFIDFSKFQLPRDYFYDLDHLNIKGANRYSKFITQYLRENN